MMAEVLIEKTDNIIEENPAKKLKPADFVEKLNNNLVTTKTLPERCDRCKQYSDQILYYNGHLNDSSEEYVALTHEKLSLFTGKEEVIDELDEIPTHKITHFSVYDEKGHLVPFDAGLVECNVPLYFSGFVKPVYEEDCSVNNGIAAHDCGPINEWWSAGFDGGEKLPIGLTTEYAQYYLMEPSPEYQPIFKNIKQKMMLAKIVVEFLLDKAWESPSLEDLIQHIASFGEYENIEDILLTNAQFICDQVYNIDLASEEARDEDDKPLITVPCIRSLVKMAGVTFRKNKKMRNNGKKEIKYKAPKWTKAVTTKLVRDVFEHFFTGQLDKRDITDENKGPKRRRCGICEACQSPDCGECRNCKDMLKFGGSGRSKQACKNKRCPSMAIQDAEMSDNEDEDDLKIKPAKDNRTHCSKRIIHNVVFSDKSDSTYKGRQCYSTAVVGDLTVKTGDFVMLKSENPKDPPCIAKVVHMFDNLPQKYMFHGHLFCRGSDTILGETSDPRELFLVDDCDDLPLGSIIQKAQVECRKRPENWSEIGGDFSLPESLEDDGKTFFYTQRMEENRFLDIDFENEIQENECSSCRRKTEQKTFNNIVFKDNVAKWKNDVYKSGSGVFLSPETYTFEHFGPDQEKEDTEKYVNEDVYPEYYRKTRKTDFIKGSNMDTADPFVIGIIEDIFSHRDEVKIKVRIFCRPENTIKTMLSYSKDLNYLYYTEEVKSVSFDNVQGKCYVAYGELFESPSEWSQQGPYRYYFTESYNLKTRKFESVPDVAKKIGCMGKGKKGQIVKGRSKASYEPPPEWEKVEPLRCMDIFAGCGGLSEGLHQAGIADTKWAIEKEIPAANAFRLNYPECKVFTNDCNELMRKLLSGQGKEIGLPEKGDVELLVGGPPCQGFSGMNRFNAGAYSLFKNSLVVSFLSYCEYLRPKYVVLENVRNFVSFKRSMVLKLTLRCLIAIGYQVTFGIVQAGHYGVPQTRRRFILMAAAPGYQLPKYPEPLHVFNKRGCQLSFAVEGIRYFSGCEWTESAPYRTINVRDAMSDLPAISNGGNRGEMPYVDGANSHFQRMLREQDDMAVLRDHVCKEMSPLVAARIEHIPTFPGADWRALPNIEVGLRDGTTTRKLRYLYLTKKQKKGEKLRGVCQCATGKSCSQIDKQSAAHNSLIPWCLPHTADRHNQWAGLYGRLEWDGFFGTTVTNPEPMGKQGRVLHPEQNRVVSVRECARSQGFPDKFKFFGTILDKHRQVGNAVPPPLGKALGIEIKRALHDTKRQNVIS
nr:unnamed protein product [Callosobruchus chinensis]